MRAEKEKTPYYAKRRVFPLVRKGNVAQSTKMEFLLEQDGWFKCRLSDGNEYWILGRDAVIVDENGNSDFRSRVIAGTWGKKEDDSHLSEANKQRK